MPFLGLPLGIGPCIERSLPVAVFVVLVGPERRHEIIDALLKVGRGERFVSLPNVVEEIPVNHVNHGEPAATTAELYERVLVVPRRDDGEAGEH